MNQAILIGRCVADPTLRFIPGSGMAVANMTLAVDKGLSREKKQQFEAEGKPTADFIRIVVWGKQAENCSQYLAKGKMVAIQGSIQTSTYKDAKGETRYQTEVLANRVEFLEWGDKSEKPLKEDDFKFEDFQSIEDDDDVPF
jgi:single-strand DNA-binding protein